jgi:hypothetical protein
VYSERAEERVRLQWRGDRSERLEREGAGGKERRGEERRGEERRGEERRRIRRLERGEARREYSVRV